MRHGPDRGQSKVVLGGQVADGNNTWTIQRPSQFALTQTSHEMEVIVMVNRQFALNCSITITLEVYSTVVPNINLNL